MSVITSIFSFDHGQKKLYNAIGVSEEFIDDTQEQIANVLKDHIFDENKDVREDRCPSQLVETALHEFSYSQLVLIAGLYLQDRLDGFAEKIENKLKAVVKKVALDMDDIPPHLKDFFMKMAQEGGSGGAINGNDLPQEVKDFLDGLTRGSEEGGDDEQ